jgi:hypothetical protein
MPFEGTEGLDVALEPPELDPHPAAAAKSSARAHDGSSRRIRV